MSRNPTTWGQATFVPATLTALKFGQESFCGNQPDAMEHNLLTSAIDQNWRRFWIILLERQKA